MPGARARPASRGGRAHFGVSFSTTSAGKSSSLPLRAGSVSAREAEALIALACQLRQNVVEWLEVDHKELL